MRLDKIIKEITNTQWTHVPTRTHGGVPTWMRNCNNSLKGTTYFAYTQWTHGPRLTAKQVFVSTIGTLPYGISNYFGDIIQLTLNKNQHKVQNSRSFVSQAQTWKIEPDEI